MCCVSIKHRYGAPPSSAHVALRRGLWRVARWHKVPSGVSLDFGFPPEQIDLSQRVSGRRHPCRPAWCIHAYLISQQVPGYLDAVSELKALGVDEVIIYYVNDGAVMDLGRRIGALISGTTGCSP